MKNEEHTSRVAGEGDDFRVADKTARDPCAPNSRVLLLAKTLAELSPMMILACNYLREDRATESVFLNQP